MSPVLSLLAPVCFPLQPHTSAPAGTRTRPGYKTMDSASFDPLKFLDPEPFQRGRPQVWESLPVNDETPLERAQVCMNTKLTGPTCTRHCSLQGTRPSARHLHFDRDQLTRLGVGSHSLLKRLRVLDFELEVVNSMAQMSRGDIG